MLHVSFSITTLSITLFCLTFLKHAFSWSSFSNWSRSLCAWLIVRQAIYFKEAQFRSCRHFYWGFFSRFCITFISEFQRHFLSLSNASEIKFSEKIRSQCRFLSWFAPVWEKFDQNFSKRRRCTSISLFPGSILQRKHRFRSLKEENLTHLNWHWCKMGAFQRASNLTNIL